MQWMKSNISTFRNSINPVKNLSRENFLKILIEYVSMLATVKKNKQTQRSSNSKII